MLCRWPLEERVASPFPCSTSGSWRPTGFYYWNIVCGICGFSAAESRRTTFPQDLDSIIGGSFTSSTLVQVQGPLGEPAAYVLLEVTGQVTPVSLVTLSLMGNNVGWINIVWTPPPSLQFWRSAAGANLLLRYETLQSCILF